MPGDGLEYKEFNDEDEEQKAGVSLEVTRGADPDPSPPPLDWKAAGAEFLAMILFVLVGCGAACSHGASDGGACVCVRTCERACVCCVCVCVCVHVCVHARDQKIPCGGHGVEPDAPGRTFLAATRLIVALTFGTAIMVLAYAVGHHSGAQINCAVTLTLVLGGHLTREQGVLNTISQLCGSLVGAVLLASIYTCENDMTSSLGSNMVSPKFSLFSALLAEVRAQSSFQSPRGPGLRSKLELKPRFCVYVFDARIVVRCS